MPVINSTSNCGVYEISGIRDYEGFSSFIVELQSDLEDVRGDHSWTWPAFLTFTDADFPFDDQPSPIGPKIAKSIVKYKLGLVIQTGWKKNPNTGNKIKLWVWTPNVRACEAFINKHTKKDKQ